MTEDVNPLELLTSRIGLSRFDLAQIVDATPGIVDAWFSGVLAPGPRSRQRLDELVEVLEAIFAKMSPWAAQRWLTTPSPETDFYEPIDMLRRGDLYSVLRIIEQMAETPRLDHDPFMLSDA